MHHHNEISELPGIGVYGAIEDCSISVQGDPGCVTVTFSTVKNEILLVLDPGYSEILAGWLLTQSGKARKPDAHLSLVKD